MTVTLEIPDTVVRELHLSAEDAQRQALTAIVVGGYRRHELSRGRVSELLDLSFEETAELLAAHGCGIGSDMTFEDYQREYEDAKAFLKR